jgi:Cu/Ag efflux protein CusF
LTMAAMSGVMPAATAVAHAKTAQSAPLTTTMKGVIKKIDDASIVVSPSTNKNAEVTFDLTSAAKREGALAAGDAVTITYYYENGKRIVTSVAGKASAK